MSQQDRFLDDATPAEWMGHFLAAHRKDVPRGKARQAFDRKLRLYAAAECRRVWPLLVQAQSRQSVEAAEAFADGAISRKEMEAIRDRARPFVEGSNSSRPEFAAVSVARWDINLAWVVDLIRHALLEAAPPVGRDADTLNRDSVGLIRCVFGDLFRPIEFDPRWKTADVTGLARGIYEERAFDRVPLLADALMDAGCGDEQVLEHCRSGGPHVRGCWVVDLVLGKQ
jgi:hypothetical protein